MEVLMDNLSAYLPEIHGVVSHGRGLGAKLGFPTANIDINPSSHEPLAMIRRGVYLCRASFNGSSLYPAIANIGTAPSVSQCRDLHAEVHLLDFSGDLYGVEMSVRLSIFLRDEKIFSSIDELKGQVLCDIQSAKAYFLYHES